MSKFPQPFYRDDRRRWYVQLGKKQVNLGPDEAQAWIEYRRVMHERDHPARWQSRAGRRWCRQYWTLAWSGARSTARS